MLCFCFWLPYHRSLGIEVIKNLDECVNCCYDCYYRCSVHGLGAHAEHEDAVADTEMEKENEIEGKAREGNKTDGQTTTNKNDRRGARGETREREAKVEQR